MSVLGDLLFSNSVDASSVLLAVALVFFAVILLRQLRFYSGCPPGPWGLPVVGYLPFFSKHPHLDLARMGEKYGNVVSFRAGERYVILLNDYDTIKEAFVKYGDIFAGKPKTGVEAYFGDHKSLFVTDGDVWRQQHRFLLSTMRDFGFGKKQLEEHLQREAKEGINALSSHENKPFDMIELTLKMATNSIAYLIFGERFEYDDPKFEMIKRQFVPQSDFRLFNYFDSFPSIERLPAKVTGFDRIVDIVEEFNRFFNGIVKEHEKTYDENNMRDIIDVYLMKIKQEQEKSNDTDKTETIYTNDHLRVNMTLLYSAGIETTSTSIAWMLKILSGHPDVQKKMQDEIDRVIGRERPPAMNDRPNMPYTEAAITEMHRMICLLAVTFYHRITEDIVFKGYQIPKNSMVLANLWNVHRNPKVFKDPIKFLPDRFLGDTEEVAKRREQVIPFSIGKRSCIGESLAKMEIFLYVTTFLQHFTFEKPAGEPYVIEPNNFNPVGRLSHYKVCAKARQ